MAHLRALLVLLACTAVLAHKHAHPEIRFAAGQPLDETPDRRAHRLISVDITLTPARILGAVNHPQLMADFYAPVYRDDATGAVSLRGPTMRVRQGEVLTINLRNNLTKPAGESHAGLNGFSHVSDTNMHVHGMHSYPGVTHQYAGVLDLANYVDNDNIFPVVPGKDRQDQAELALQSYTINPVCKEHMPGMAWAHPHQHGSTTLQVPTASLLVIIEGGPEWLPDANGCREVRQLLDAAPEKVLYFQMLPFRPPADATPTTPQWAQDLDDANYQTASRLSDPPNPLPEPKGSAIDRDTVLLNGGFQPRIFMKSGEYQRWRLAWATSKRWASIGIVDKSGQPAPCEMLLVGKDAVYLMEIPRKVSHAYLAAGNRAEMLVKCKGRPGSEYVLRAQAAQESPFRCCTNPYCSRNAIVQDLGTIEIKPGKEQRSPKLKACTPARAGYTADLRDASLAAAGATDKLVKQELAFGFKDFGCLFNGENFTFPDPNPIELPLGSVVEFASAKMHAHPLHIHTNPFQLIELPEENLQPGCSYSDWFEPGDFQASHLTQCGSQHVCASCAAAPAELHLPPACHASHHDPLQDVLMIPVVLPNASVRLRIQPGEFTGYGVTHCHSLMHEDVGCMKLTHFTCPGYTDPQPRECPFTWAVPPTVILPGDTRPRASMHMPAGAQQPPAGWRGWARRWAKRLGLWPVL